MWDIGKAGRHFGHQGSFWLTLVRILPIRIGDQKALPVQLSDRDPLGNVGTGGFRPRNQVLIALDPCTASPQIRLNKIHLLATCEPQNNQSTSTPIRDQLSETEPSQEPTTTYDHY